MSDPTRPAERSAPSGSRIFAVWWPLAVSWLLMGAELPALSAVVARLEDPEVQLAAYGGIVFPLALIIESPIIMLLAASTALSRDRPSYLKIRRFMMAAGAGLTALHAAVAFTPLYDPIARGILRAPEEILEPGRIGLMVMLPWTWSIAYRRFHQGVMIRFGRSGSVGIGTAVRLGAVCGVLAIGYGIGTIPGIVVGAAAVIAGVLGEAVYVGIAVRPILRGPLREAPPVHPPLTLAEFLRFYNPLVLTSLLSLLASPIGSAAMGRMPRTIESLAAWAPLFGLAFMFRSPGVAYNEVVVALLDVPGSSAGLRRFAGLLSAATTGILLAAVATPLAGAWFGRVSALDPDLAAMAGGALWLALPLPALTVLQSWYQGALLHGRVTRGITESVALSLAVSAAVLAIGVAAASVPGLYVASAALLLGNAAQTAWLWMRSRGVRRGLRERDASLPGGDRG